MSKNIGPLWAVILAAGQGTRLAQASGGVKKQFLQYQGAPLFWNSALTMSNIPQVSGLVFVFPPDQRPEMAGVVDELNAEKDLGLPYLVVDGGARRQDSVYNGITALPNDTVSVLVHDAARPFASPALIQELIKALEAGRSGAIPAVAVKDTIKQVAGDVVEKTLVRRELRAVQTPQAFVLADLLKAHHTAQREDWEVTDDASMLEMLGLEVLATPGEETNVKITTPEDLALIEKDAPRTPRTGWGYDVHRYGPGRPMVLGGVAIPGGPEVVAHSDGDVLLHALMDAILGCACMGDIGQHFPDTSDKFDGISSGVLLKETLSMVREKGLELVHADLTIIAQVPKLSPYREQIRKNVASLLELDMDCVNVKATTEEKLGFTGEKKGIKAVAQITAFI